MSGRISPVAPFGSLLKGAPKPKGAKALRGGVASVPTRTGRERKAKSKRESDRKHLAAVRRCPCLSCDVDPVGEAAHLRMTIAGKSITGTAIKPPDRWSLPLCHTCHMRQHAEGERPFWNALGLDPLAIAARLYAVTGTLSAMRAVIFAERERRK